MNLSGMSVVNNAQKQANIANSVRIVQKKAQEEEYMYISAFESLSSVQGKDLPAG